MQKRIFTGLIGGLVFVSIFSCFQESLSESRLKTFLDEQEETFEQISISMGTAYWKLYTEGGETDLKTPKQRFAALFLDEDLNSILDRWYGRRDEMKDPVLKRRVELWHNILTGAAVDLDEDILALTDRLETWLSAGAGSEDKPSPEEMEKAVLKLMKLRNIKARERGFSDYPEMILSITGLNPDFFYSFVDILEKRTLAPYQNLLTKIKTEQNKTTVGTADIQAMMGRFMGLKAGPRIAKEQMLPLMKETVGNIGIPFDSLPLRFEERDMPAGIGGQGFAVSIPEDFRVVVMPSLPFESRLHELGHGLQWMFTSAASPILKGYEWSRGNSCGAFDEGMAETMARFSKNPEWLKKYADSSEAEFLDQHAEIRKMTPAYIRFMLNMFMFEVEFYKNLDQDPSETARMLQHRYLLIDEPLKKPKSLASMIYVSYPLYIQSYLIGDMVSWQVHEALKNEFGKGYVFNPKVGSWLEKNLWRKGALLPWRRRLKEATGKDLDIEGYLRYSGIT